MKKKEKKEAMKLQQEQSKNVRQGLERKSGRLVGIIETSVELALWLGLLQKNLQVVTSEMQSKHLARTLELR